MGHPARQSRGPAFLWLAVGYMLTDTVASLKLLSPVDLPPESMPQGGDGDSGSGGGGSGGDTRAVLVDKLIRFWFSSKLQRGELVLMR